MKGVMKDFNLAVIRHYMRVKLERHHPELLKALCGTKGIGGG